MEPGGEPILTISAVAVGANAVIGWWDEICAPIMFRPANTIYSVLSSFVAEKIDSLERQNKEEETVFHGNLIAVNQSPSPRHSNVKNLENLTQTKKAY